MINSRNKLYLLLLTIFAAGYGWLFYNLFSVENQTNSVTVCLFKNITTIPCPSCGITRSLEQILYGNFNQALLINPLGFIIILALLIIPFWLLFDIILNKNTFYLFYHKIETQIKKPRIAIFLIFIVLANWIWNILKNL